MKVRPASAFTLVELLVVMAISLVILGLIVPSTRSVLESGHLTRAGQLLADEIGLARQLASAHNCTIEVRLIRDTSVLAAGSGYNMVQLFMPGTGSVQASAAGASASNLVAADKAYTLPSTMVIAGDINAPGLSPLLGKLTANQTMPLPGRGSTGFPYAAFQVKPSGEVTPVYTAATGAGQGSDAATVMSPLYLTVVPVRFLLAASLPPNYVIVQINPFTGTPIVYRP